MAGRTLNRRVAVALAAGAVAVAGTGGGIALRAGTGHASAPGNAPTSTAPVIRTDLSTTQQVNGTLGYDGSYTVLDLVGTTASQRATTQAQLAQAQAQQAAGDQAAVDARGTSTAQTAADQALLDQYTAAVDADQRQLAADQAQQSRDTAAQQADCTGTTPTAACTADRTAVTADTGRVSADLSTSAKDQQSVAQEQGKVAVDRAQGQQAVDAASAQAAQAGAQAGALQASGATTAPTTITWVPQIGDTVSAGQRLYALDGRPVVLLTGTTPILRQLGLGVPDGPDVAVLKQNLAALGFNPGPINDHFDQATATAVRAWQASLGEPQDGVVRLGDVYAEPTAVRVTGVSVAAGSATNPGGTVLTGTSTTPVVTVPLSPAKEYLVHVGDQVMVDLPDGQTTTTGHVRTISTVAASSGSGSSGSGSGASAAAQSQQQGQQALAANTTVAVTITLDNPAAVRVLDQAPVQVDITDQTVRGVLAVPVDALLALAGGGYGVQLVNGGDSHPVAVQIGLFGNGLVQVSGPGVAAGATVEVPSP